MRILVVEDDGPVASALKRGLVAEGYAVEVAGDGVDGLHFEVSNPLDLAETMVRAATEGGLWQRLRDNIREPPTLNQCADSYLALVG